MADPISTLSLHDEKMIPFLLPRVYKNRADLVSESNEFINQMKGKCIYCKFKGDFCDHATEVCVKERGICFVCMHQGHQRSDCRLKIKFSQGNCYFCGFKNHRYGECSGRRGLTIPLAWLLYQMPNIKVAMIKDLKILNSEQQFADWLGNNNRTSMLSGVQIVFEWFLQNVKCP